MAPLRAALLLACAAALAVGAPPAAPAASGDALLPPGLHFYTGDFHAHTGFSDGEGSPAEAYAVARANGLDVLELTEHSELLAAPLTGAACLGGPDPASCPLGVALTKWDSLARAAADATVPGAFVALRGFEQTMDTQGHLTVLGSAGYIDRIETGDALMPPFWLWFTGALPQAVLPDGHATSGADGLGAFAHPNSNKNHIPGQDSWRWDDFAYQPDADARMASIEVENTGSDHSMWYAHALDKGWHVAPTSVSDSHHLGFGAPAYGRTLLVAPELTPQAVRASIAARHTAATWDASLRVVLSSDAHIMGDRWSVPDGASVPVTVRWSGAARPVQSVQLVTDGGVLLASGAPAGESFGATLTVRGAGEHYVFARLAEQGGALAYTAPVWVRAT